MVQFIGFKQQVGGEQGPQLSTHRKQDASRNSGKAARNESRDPGPKEKYWKGEKFEPGVRADTKGLPHTTGLTGWGEMINLVAQSALNSPAWFLLVCPEQLLQIQGWGKNHCFQPRILSSDTPKNPGSCLKSVLGRWWHVLRTWALKMTVPELRWPVLCASLGTCLNIVPVEHRPWCLISDCISVLQDWNLLYWVCLHCAVFV